MLIDHIAVVFDGGDPEEAPKTELESLPMWGRWFLIGLLHVGSCLACMYFKLRIYDPDATASQALSVVLVALGALPFGWLIAIAGGSPSTQFGLFIVNSFLWGAGIEWLLQRFVDRPKNPISK